MIKRYFRQEKYLCNADYSLEYFCRNKRQHKYKIVLGIYKEGYFETLKEFNSDSLYVIGELIRPIVGYNTEDILIEMNS